MKAIARAIEPADACVDSICSPYLQVLMLVERLHRRLLDVIKDEFDRRGRTDTNPVQALIIYNIGDQQLCAGELRTRGYYLGTNVTYNLKKLVETGVLENQRSSIDRRSVRIKLTTKGREVYECQCGSSALAHSRPASRRAFCSTRRCMASCFSCRSSFRRRRALARSAPHCVCCRGPRRCSCSLRSAGLLSTGYPIVRSNREPCSVFQQPVSACRKSQLNACETTSAAVDRHLRAASTQPPRPSPRSD